MLLAAPLAPHAPPPDRCWHYRDTSKDAPDVGGEFLVRARVAVIVVPVIYAGDRPVVHVLVVSWHAAQLSWSCTG
jgi:hypothetical protein